jgi:hemolysin activation/secretion protein
MQFRLGGPESVRGYDYGFRRGKSGWAAQADVALTRGIVTPVVFADAGNTFTSDKPLLSVGGGVSILDGMIRFNISGGLQPKTDVRFDLLFRAAR